MALDRTRAIKVSRLELARQKKLTVGAGRSEIVVVWRRGSPRAFSGVCPHLGGPLAEGVIKGDLIRCPWHLYQFDLDKGTCLTKPGKPWQFSVGQQQQGPSAKPRYCLRLLNIEADGDTLWIENVAL